MTDWPVIIEQLQRRLRLVDIADRIGMTESWVSQLKRGVIPEPRHSIGQIILALHAELCVPREAASPRQHAES